jgi:hypothetical protein
MGASIGAVGQSVALLDAGGLEGLVVKREYPILR